MSVGSAGDDLDLTAGGEVDGWRGLVLTAWNRGGYGFCTGLGSTQRSSDVGVLAVVGEPFLGPGLDDHVDGFLEPLAAGVDVDADAVEFLLLVAGADAEVEAAVADHIQHGDFLGDEDGVVQGQDDYGGADADVFGASRHCPQE